MILGACLGQPSPTFRCDGLQTCWTTVFATQALYQGCVDAANTAIGTCNDACAATFAAAETDATTAQTSCTAACDTEDNSCTSGCESDYEACELVCELAYNACVNAVNAEGLTCQNGCATADDPEACRTACGAASAAGLAGCAAAESACTPGCDSALAACLPPCAETQCGCYISCYKAYDEAMADPTTAQDDCNAKCCCNNTDSSPVQAGNKTFNDCNNTCQKAYHTAQKEARDTLFTAINGHCNVSGVSIFLPHGAGIDFPVGGDDSTIAAQVTFLLSATKNEYALTECQYLCSLAYQAANNGCSGLSSCLQASEKAWDTADLACQQAYYSGGTNDALVTCQLSNQQTKWGNDQQCCFYANGGSDPYSVCVKGCQFAFNGCEKAVIASCPNPSDNEVCDPTSDSYDADACAALETVYSACTAAATAACTSTLTGCLTGCITSATAPLPCSGCDKVFV